MKRPISYLSIFLPALAVLSHIQVLSAADTRSGVRHTIIVESGAATPAGGHYSPFSFLNARLNAQHAVAFDAFVIGPLFTSGVFVGDGTTTSTIALGVSPNPATPSFGSVLNPFITRNGAVVFTTGAGEVFRSDGRDDRSARADRGPGARRRCSDAAGESRCERRRRSRLFRRCQRRGGHPGNLPDGRDADHDNRPR